MKAIGVYSARVRVEEKQIIAAVGDAGCLAVPVLPASMPLPPGPASPHQAMLGDVRNGSSDEGTQVPLDVIIDRCTNRAVAGVSLQLARLGGVAVIDAGLAATGSRVAVASALERAGIPRPASMVGFSEASSVDAAGHLGYPVTLFGLVPGTSSTPLQDADTADAVIEHRVVLGDDSEAIVLIQAGAPDPGERSLVHVVGGAAIATAGISVDAVGLMLAERAAVALGAGFVTIELARTPSGLVVWDALPVVDFRQAAPVGEMSVAGAIASLALKASSNPVNGRSDGGQATLVGEVRRDFALSA